MPANPSRSHIEARLKELGKDWQWLGLQLEASKTTVSNWKQRGISPRHYAGIAKALNRSIEWVASEGERNVVQLPQADPWPFKLVDRAKYEALSPEGRGAAQIKMMDEIDRLLHRDTGNGKP